MFYANCTHCGLPSIVTGSNYTMGQKTEPIVNFECFAGHEFEMPFRLARYVRNEYLAITNS